MVIARALGESARRRRRAPASLGTRGTDGYPKRFATILATVKRRCGHLTVTDSVEVDNGATAELRPSENPTMSTNYGAREGERRWDEAQSHHGDDGGDGEARGGSTAPESETETAR